jgi:multidrug resistance protein, MATE family
MGDQNHIDLRLDTSYKQIMKIALPISAAILVPQFNFITNNIFLGILGETELAAAGITGVFYLIFGSIGYGLNNGLQALISRRAGENKINAIGRIFNNGIYIAMGIALTGILLTYFVVPHILKATIHNEALYQMCIDFLRIRIWGLPFLYMYQMRNAFMVGTNQSKFLLAGTLAETLGNIFFDYSLIYGKFGMPALGFNGAAYASIIAEFLGMVVMMFMIGISGAAQRFHLRENKLDSHTSKLILAQSSPLIFQHAISIISWELFYILIEHHGQRSLAISNTMRNIFGFFGVFTWAFAATSNTMVSNIIGQKKQEEVIPLILKIIKLSTGIAIIVCLLLNIFAPSLLRIYGQGEEFILEAIPVLRIVSTALILMSFSVVWLNAVTGTGNTRINLLIEICAIVLYILYVFIVLEWLNLPITWGWASELLYWSVLFILSYLYIRSGKWKNKIL